MVSAVADFRSFLGPQLKAVSGDSQAWTAAFHTPHLPNPVTDVDRIETRFRLYMSWFSSVWCSVPGH